MKRKTKIVFTVRMEGRKLRNQEADLSLSLHHDFAKAIGVLAEVTALGALNSCSLIAFVIDGQLAGRANLLRMLNELAVGEGAGRELHE